MSILDNPSERDSLETILKSKTALDSILYIKDLLSSMSSIICILNNKNQIVFTNDIISRKYELELESDILGFRTGEVFNCVNAKNDTGGCGTSEKCQYCGANNAYLESWKDQKKVVNECRIVKHDGIHTSQLDLEITVTPFFHEEEYLIVSIQDITEKKRKDILERIFFHDIINIAGSLSGILKLFPQLEESEKEEYLNIANSLSDQIIDEIKGQQQMLKAESGELEVHIDEIEMQSFLRKICDQIRFNQVAFEKEVKMIDLTQNIRFQSDESLLTRVLFNMTKNALEAVTRGSEIEVRAENGKNKISIAVHNNTYIEEEVQQQLFQRSYSTKGKNRGLGTYSMKLLGERYLKGVVNFTSTPEEGTTFYIEIPMID